MGNDEDTEQWTTDRLRRLVSAYYESPYVEARYLARAEEPLRPWEETVARKYCRTTGPVLVVGAGAGREVRALRALGIDAHGIERHPKLYAHACNVLGLAQYYRNEDIEEAALEAVHSHVALWSQFLGSVVSEGERMSLLRRMSAALREDGLLSFSVHDRDSTIKEAERQSYDVCHLAPHGLENGDYIMKSAEEDRPCYWHLFDGAEVRRLCEGVGLKIVNLASGAELADPLRSNLIVGVCSKA
jgi:SAM-dependent methyltransferase